MTMAIPSTGTDFKGGGFVNVDNRFASRGQLAAVLVRDNRGAATNISPYSAGTPSPTVNFSPFALDGTLRNDLFAYELVNGQWEFNHAANMGFWLVGAFEERSGPDRKGSIRHDDVMILQSNFPFDTDLTAEGITVAFTGIEVFKPFMMRLRLNLPLNDVNGNIIVEQPGHQVILSKPTEADPVDRQLLLIFARKRPGGYVYSVEAYPLARLTDIGARKRSKTDQDAAMLTFTVLPDPYYVDLDPAAPLSGNLVPALYSEYVGGSAWTAMAATGSI
jgi:hypothetical protein